MTEIVGPANGLEVPRFAGPRTFARLPRRDEVSSVGVAVVGVPFDAGVSYRPGARFGPAALRDGSKLMRPYNPATGVWPFKGKQVADCGDVTCTPFDIPVAVSQIEAGLSSVLSYADSYVVLGGDHTIALPSLRALHAVHGPLALLHFDAHLDTWNTYFDAPYTHGTPFRRAAEEGLLASGRLAHVGIRGPLYSAADLTDDEALGFTIVHCTDVDAVGVPEIVSRVRSRVGDAPLYISVDIDVLDPAFAPGTGTPEAGGLTSRELLAIIRGLAGCNVVGGDVVEVSPAYDHAEVTAIAGATVAYELIGLLSQQTARISPESGAS